MYICLYNNILYKKDSMKKITLLILFLSIHTNAYTILQSKSIITLSKFKKLFRLMPSDNKLEREILIKKFNKNIQFITENLQRIDQLRNEPLNHLKGDPYSEQADRDFNIHTTMEMIKICINDNEIIRKVIDQIESKNKKLT